jgi:hypothetical protein
LSPHPDTVAADFDREPAAHAHVAHAADRAPEDVLRLEPVLVVMVSERGRGHAETIHRRARRLGIQCARHLQPAQREPGVVLGAGESILQSLAGVLDLIEDCVPSFT